MKNILALIIGLTIPSISISQSLDGKVTDEKNLSLPGATVYWLGTTNATTTDSIGKFEISIPAASVKKLVISMVGYQSDTMSITKNTPIHVILKSINQLNQVTVRGNRPGQYISSINPIKTEVLTISELRKASCCDLAACFSTNGSVQTVTTNIVTNAQELRVLGLGGVYNQVLIDGFPMIQGLTYTYGISNIPGPLVNNIFISKGANSVLQGYESISGQINVLTLDPSQSDKFYFDAYVNSFMEKQFNAYYTVKKAHWGNILFMHTVQPGTKIDQDHDNFLDAPLITRYEAFDKFIYGKQQDYGWYTQIAARIVDERRIGGQTFFNPNTDEGTTNAYGQVIKYTQPEIMSKTAYRFDGNNRIVLIASAYNENQNSWYGLTNYKGVQNTLNSTLQYEYTYGAQSTFKTGINYRYFNLDENILFAQNPFHLSYEGQYNKLENIPGAFAENTLYFLHNKFTWIAGMRLDHHNQFGFYYTPRTLLDYALTPQTDIRASAGYGWRTVNIFSENAYLLASSRNIIFTQPLTPERAINTGGNLTQRFEQKNLKGTFTIDFYHTRFLNQIFPDYTLSPTAVYISNFTGTSISNALQAGISVTLYKKLSLGTTYNYLNVYRIENGTKYVQPYIPQNTLLATLSYKPLNAKWHTDINIHWFGVEQLPSTADYPVEYQRPSQSEPYTTVNAQFSYTFKVVELYGGCENIFDFRQYQPIISWQNPFSGYFDTSSAWGPTKGRLFYIGMRLEIK